MRRGLFILLFMALILTACRSPEAGSPEPRQPGGEQRRGGQADDKKHGSARRWAVYLATKTPAVAGATKAPGVEVVSDMAAMKAVAGGDLVALWIDAAAAGQVERTWLANQYQQRRPIFVIGAQAHRVLLDLIGLADVMARPAMGASRQETGTAYINETFWPSIPDVKELLSQSERLLTQGGVKVESVSLQHAPAQVREFTGKMGKIEIAQTLTLGKETYLLIAGGWDVVSAHREMGVIRVKATKKADAPSVAIWRLQADGMPIDISGEGAYLPQVINKHGLPERPITREAELITPTPATKGTGRFHITGYVRAFEAAFGVRLKNAAGQIIAQQHAMSAAGGPDWGSFALDLPYKGTGDATLEVYVISMKDGAVIVLTAVPVQL